MNNVLNQLHERKSVRVFTDREISAEEKASIQHKYDKKMTVFIFTAILAGEKERAAKALKEWKGEKNTTNRLLRMGLRIAKLMPAWVNRFVFGIRMKVF